MTRKSPSDHFDGRRFFNPTLAHRTDPSRLAVLRMMREPRAPWPAWVENKGVPRLDHPLRNGEIAVTFVNHATFLIQTGGVAILTDPVWSDRVSPFRRVGPKRVRAPGVPFGDLPKIDLVLLSHNHYDHLDLATLRQLRQRFDPIVLHAAGDRRLIGPLAFTRSHELDWWDAVVLADGLTATFVPAQHFSARGLLDRRKSLWGGYVIESRGRRIYFGGDSGYSTHFADIRRRLGAPDVAMLGIGAYEPRWFMQPIHMDPAEAVRAHRDLAARRSIAMHFGTFQLTTEAIDAPVTELRRALADGGVADGEFVALDEGETRIY
jgi:L-ascorbate metabolism protein UlaG (beta-lactamase superfamily)